MSPHSASLKVEAGCLGLGWQLAAALHDDDFTFSHEALRYCSPYGVRAERDGQRGGEADVRLTEHGACQHCADDEYTAAGRRGW